MFASRYVALAAVSLCAAGAQAAFIFGEPITVLNDSTTASISFVTARANWSGLLYLANPNSTTSMGTALFNNLASRAGDTRSLGIFNADDTVTFNYRVTSGTRNDWRMATTPEHFGLELLDSRTVVVHVEDMPMSFSDNDYDDCVAIVRFSGDVILGHRGGGTETPTPGTAALLALGAAASTLRRRR